MKRPPGETDRPAGRRHAIADHALGADASHEHLPGEEHDHDHDGHDHGGADLLPEGRSDNVVLTSIGIDIGSSGTQVAFARLTLENTSTTVPPHEVPSRPPPASAVPNTQRATTRRRETLYQSPVFLTPFADGHLIDASRLDAIVASAFEAARLTADDIDCGVVILTGAARERDNAAAISTSLATTCGDIVSASAGHHMEARIAAHGSGAAGRSAEYGARLLNIDIGGATTKLAVCEAGRVTATAALAIGGRLVVTDKSDRIVRLEPAGRAHAQRAGFQWQLGGPAPWNERKAVGEAMADALVAALTGSMPAEVLAEILLTGPLPDIAHVSGLVVSGGVGEYVYGRETRSFSDVGLPLGRALASRIDKGALRWPLMPAGECIRATVIGASSHTVQLSGRTGFISDPGRLLPRRNLPVVRPWLGLAEGPDAQVDPVAIGHAIGIHLATFDLDGGIAGHDGDVILALDWKGPPEHARLKAFAAGVKYGFKSRLEAGRPLYVMLEADIAASLGAILRDELGVANDALVLDGVELADLDYVDLGRIRLPSGTVPLTIKSLVFRDEPRQKARQSPPRHRRTTSHRN